MASEAKEKPGEIRVPRWHERFAGVDLLMLHASPVFYGAGVPRGDGSAVLLLPGLLHSDAYLMVMYAWLSRLGYRPCFAGIELNADCPDLLIRFHLMELLEQTARESGKKVHLVGHSLGGIIARSLAAQRPELVASVTSLGSPVRDVLVHRSILLDTEAVRRFIQRTHGLRVPGECYTQRCPCEFVQALGRGIPAAVRQTSIFTRSDGVLDWRACRTGEPGIDVEVRGTHAGLAFNPDVYQAIGERLAPGA